MSAFTENEVAAAEEKATDSVVVTEASAGLSVAVALCFCAGTALSIEARTAEPMSAALMHLMYIKTCIISNETTSTRRAKQDELHVYRRYYIIPVLVAVCLHQKTQRNTNLFN